MTPREEHMCAVCRIAVESGVTPRQVMGESQKATIVRARHRAMQHFHHEGWSSTRIGRFFNRDHTTVLAALKKGAL